MPALVGFIKAGIDAYVEANALEAPAEAGEAAIPDGLVPLRELDIEAAGVSAVVWATGYRLDLGWIVDADFDEQGFPVHQG